jgi:hypothetical protein
MLLVALLFLLAWISTHYFGALIWFRLYQFKLHQEEEYLPAGLSNILGMAGIALVASLIHFFSSIRWNIMFTIFLLIIVQWKSTYQYFSHSLRQLKPHLGWLIPATLFSWVAILLRPGMGDIADYHLQDILWAENYPLVKGLGNFNRPLANNNWWFNVQAVFGLNQITAASLYVGNALFFISTLTWFIVSPIKSQAQQWFRLVFIAFIILSLKTAFVGAVTSDYVVTLTLYILVDLFLIGILSKEDWHWTQLYIFLLVCFMVTVKATALTFFMLPLPWLWKLLKNKDYSYLLKIIGISLLFFVPYFIGNILLSGYVLYPFNQIDLFEVDWKVPAYFFELDKVILKNWAKIPGQDVYQTAKYPIQQWLPIWFAKLDFLNKSLLIAFLFSLPYLIFRLMKQPKLIWVCLFLILGYLIIFINGPHPRFLFAYMVSTIAFALYVTPIRFNPKPALQILWILLIGVGLLLSYTLVRDTPAEYVYLKAKPYPINNLEQREIKGFKFYYSPLNNTIWDQFPASYYMIDSVTLRTNNVRDGFRVESKSH